MDTVCHWGETDLLLCGYHHYGDTDPLLCGYYIVEILTRYSVDVFIVEIQTCYCVNELCQELGEAVQVPPLDDLEELHCDLQTGVMKP